MDAANEQNARLRELNQRFAAEINSTRKAAGDAESDAKRSAATASEFVALAKAENAQLKRVNEELSAELAAANKATEAARAAAREKATAGEGGGVGRLLSGEAGGAKLLHELAVELAEVIVVALDLAELVPGGGGEHSLIEHHRLARGGGELLVLLGVDRGVASRGGGAVQRAQGRARDGGGRGRLGRRGGDPEPGLGGFRNGSEGRIVAPIAEGGEGSEHRGRPSRSKIGIGRPIAVVGIAGFFVVRLRMRARECAVCTARASPTIPSEVPTGETSETLFRNGSFSRWPTP